MINGKECSPRYFFRGSPTVQAGGSAVVTQADVVQGNRLPPGRYVVTVRVSGSRRNWDCQTLFVQIVD